MLFTYLGAAYLPSGLISLLFGLAPLFVGLLAHGVFRTQVLRAEQWLGMGMAFGGLLLILQGGPAVARRGGRVSGADGRVLLRRLGIPAEA